MTDWLKFGVSEPVSKMMNRYGSVDTRRIIVSRFNHCAGGRWLLRLCMGPKTRRQNRWFQELEEKSRIYSGNK